MTVWSPAARGRERYPAAERKNPCRKPAVVPPPGRATALRSRPKPISLRGFPGLASAVSPTPRGALRVHRQHQPPRRPPRLGSGGSRRVPEPSLPSVGLPRGRGALGSSPTMSVPPFPRAEDWIHATSRPRESGRRLVLSSGPVVRQTLGRSASSLRGGGGGGAARLPSCSSSRSPRRSRSTSAARSRDRASASSCAALARRESASARRSSPASQRWLARGRESRKGSRRPRRASDGDWRSSFISVGTDPCQRAGARTSAAPSVMITAPANSRKPAVTNAPVAIASPCASQ